MATVFEGLITQEEIAEILSLSEVGSAKEVIDTLSVGKVFFTAQLTTAVKQKLKDTMGVDLFAVENVPMRWIKGDTAPHIDVGQTAFANTYLVYLTACPGKFRVGQELFPITEGGGFVFSEGLLHETVGMGTEARLLIGPMSEAGRAVGASYIRYYPTQQDAINQTNMIGESGNGEGSYTVGFVLEGGDIGSFTRWRIADAGDGSSSTEQTYSNGDELANDGYYRLYPVTEECCGIIPAKVSYEVRTNIIQGALSLQYQDPIPLRRPKSYDVRYAQQKAAASRK